MDVSNKAQNSGFALDQDEKKIDPFPSKCHVCDRDLSLLKNPKGHVWNCVSKGKRGPMCPKCGKHFPYRTSHNHMLKHTEVCDPIGKMCKSDHEHQLYDKEFGTLEEAIAHFYDNEFDSEFGIGSSTKYKTKIRKKTGAYDKLYFKCCRSGTKNTGWKCKIGARTSRKLNESCTAKFTINQTTNTLNGEQLFRMYGCMA